MTKSSLKILSDFLKTHKIDLESKQYLSDYIVDSKDCVSLPENIVERIIVDAYNGYSPTVKKISENLFKSSHQYLGYIQKEQLKKYLDYRRDSDFDHLLSLIQEDFVPRELKKLCEIELENDNDYYIKDNEQEIPTDIASPSPTPAIDVPELNPVNESVIIKESNGRYRKYTVFEVDEDAINKPAEVQNLPPVEIPQGDIANKPEEPEVEPIEQKEPSEEIRAVEKIIIKEHGKLKFKSVFTEAKKKA